MRNTSRMPTISGWPMVARVPERQNNSNFRKAGDIISRINEIIFFIYFHYPIKKSIFHLYFKTGRVSVRRWFSSVMFRSAWYRYFDQKRILSMPVMHLLMVIMAGHPSSMRYAATYGPVWCPLRLFTEMQADPACAYPASTGACLPSRISALTGLGIHYLR